MKPSQAIRAVTFDVGGTLIEPWPSVGHIYAEVAAQHGLGNLSAETLSARFKAAWSKSENFDYTKSGWEQLVNRVFQGLISTGGSVAFFPQLYQRFAERDAWRVFDDVRPALQRLRESGIRLGVISNWDERLRGLLRRLDLHDCFETVVISCEAGCSKPHPRIFERAAAQLGLPPASILHVGDDPDRDVRGARSAGFCAVAVERGGKALADAALRSLAELSGRIGAAISLR